MIPIMIELMISKITQAVLIVSAAILALMAELESANIWDEAAKYGFAVLFLLVVVYLLYKDYIHEKNYSKDVNDSEREYLKGQVQDKNEEIRRLNKLIADYLEEKNQEGHA